MAHFYGDLQGCRGAATRMGTKNSGISAHIRGWDFGVRVSVRWDEAKQKDVVSVRLTGGSNGHHGGRCLGEYTVDDLFKGKGE